MCGRYSFGRTDRVDWGRFGVPPVPDLVPNWNISPGSDVLAVREGETALLRWGLVPAWAGDPSIGNRLINARSESAEEKPAFRDAFRTRRCLLVADGFYEWESVAGQKRRQPWRVEGTDGAIFAMGSLWESWFDRRGTRLESCTILTVPANGALAHIHDRMPLIVAPADYAEWIAQGTPAERVRALCCPAPDAAFTAWRISLAINAAANNDLAVTQPIV